MTGVQEIAILRNNCVHLPLIFAQMGSLGRQVSTYIAPVADFVDTCWSGQPCQPPLEDVWGGVAGDYLGKV